MFDPVAFIGEITGPLSACSCSCHCEGGAGAFFTDKAPCTSMQRAVIKRSNGGAGGAIAENHVLSFDEGRTAALHDEAMARRAARAACHTKSHGSGGVGAGRRDAPAVHQQRPV